MVLKIKNHITVYGIEKSLSADPGRQCHGDLFLKDANKKVRLSLFNASLAFSLCPNRQEGRPYRQPLRFGARLCKSLTLNCRFGELKSSRSIVLMHTCAGF
jgi:hypothetical protein